jgi:uncharacterized protein (TIGR02266 family)
MSGQPSPVRGPRFEVDIEVDCATREMFVANQVTNISRGGLFIRSAHPLPINSEVELRLHIPGADPPIAVHGRVVWNYDMAKGTTHLVAGSGIRFLDLSPRDRAALERYLDELARVAGPAAPRPDRSEAAPSPPRPDRTEAST